MDLFEISQKYLKSNRDRSFIIQVFIFALCFIFLGGTVPGDQVHAQENSPTPLPGLEVIVTADPASQEEPGGDVAFVVEIVNNHMSSEGVMITEMVNDVHGDLNGQGTCSVPQTVKAGESYSCSFNVDVSSTETSTVTVLGTDTEDVEISGVGEVTVTITDATPVIEIIRTANPERLEEPGSNVTFGVDIISHSVSSDPLTIAVLEDDIYGDLNGLGTCAVPQAIEAGERYSCSFDAIVATSETSTLTVIGMDSKGVEVSSFGDVLVTITDALPQIEVVMTATPDSLQEPGGTVTFSVEITNTSVDSDPVTITVLEDDIQGDLNGQGNCSLPQTINSREIYSCSYDAIVTTSEKSTVTVSGTDDEGTPVNCAADVEVTVADARQVSPPEYFSATITKLDDGTTLEKVIINGPPVPPPGFVLERLSVSLPTPNQQSGTGTLTVPAYDWSFGCSATSAAMIAGYFDINGFPDIYTGPTNGGVMPMNNSVWPDWVDGCGDTLAQNPLSATHAGLDGRSPYGHVDDYWTCYNSTADDPFIVGGWPQHVPKDAAGDFMYTNQSTYEIPDGATQFWGLGSNEKLYCSELEAIGGIYAIDGTVGFKNFYQSRGYAVTDCYYQLTDNQYAGGFSFENYKEEIDAGQPVMIHVTGHTMVGVGYADPSTVYLHDTWDYSTHSMFWGGSYLGMDQFAVSIVHLGSPEMDVQGNSQSIADGDSTPSTFDDTDFGEAEMGVDTVPHTFTIENTGIGDLNLTDSPEVQITGIHAADFSVSSLPSSPVAASGGTTTFQITFNPNDIGLRQAEISISNDDLDVNPYNFTIQGTGVVTFADVPPIHWAFDYIEALWDGGYTAGCTTDPLAYCPEQIMNRAMSAVFMLRGQFGTGYTPPVSPWGTFTDDWSLSDISWSEKWAEGMWEEGLTAGCLADPLMYCPRRELPRVEAAVFALRMLHGVSYSPPAATGILFSDMTDPGYWGAKWAEQAFRDGLIPECGWVGSTPTFCPDDLVDRALGAYLIVLAKDLPLPTTLAQPALTAPADTATLTDPQPTFEWDEVSGVYIYNLQIALSGNLGTTDLLVNEWVLAADVCSGGTCSWQVGTGLANNNYDWQLRGRDSSYDLTPWSETWTFTISD